MQVPAESLKILFQKAAQVRQEIRDYCLAPDQVPASVDNIQAAVQRMYGVVITKKTVRAPATSHLLGMLLRWDNNSVEILVRAGLSDELQRFVVVKEISQLILDEPEDWSPRAVETLSGLLTASQLESGGEIDHEPELAHIVGEHLAMICALVLLYPLECWERDAALVAADPNEYDKIAFRYKLPVHMIKRALSANIRSLAARFQPQN